MPVGYGLKPQVGGIKIVTVYKRFIFQVEWLIATLIQSRAYRGENSETKTQWNCSETAPKCHK